MAFEACPQCGSPGIRGATIHDGGLAGAGELLLSVCRRCGFRGAPLRFEDADAYLAYAQEMNAGSADGDGAAGAGGADADAGDAPAEATQMLDVPAPRPSRGTSLFIGALAVPVLAFGGFVSLAGVRGLSPLGIAYGLIIVGVGLAMVVGAVRLWGRRGPEPPAA